jgi:NAD(P)-dependent dehydrogenase (short-subunit alcohol dehydrogenase family)
MPLYSLAKGMLPNLVKILALELAASGHIVVGITLDVIKGGMNRGINPITQQAHADRSPWGELAELTDVAKQVVWVLESRSRLLSGSTLDFTAGSLP